METIIKDNTANPAPLGLLGFGMTTILLNIHNAGFFELNSMIMAMGIFVGGLAQLIAGIMEWKKNNTFGTTAFTAYGAFWLSLVTIWIFPKLGIAEAPSAASMGCYLLMWGIFTFGMFIGTLRQNRASQVVFFTLFLLFLGLAFVDFTQMHNYKYLVGFEGIFCGCSAIYASLAQVLNEVYKKEILPLGTIKN